MRTSDLYPDLESSSTDFTALDRDEPVGRVHQVQHGTEAGLLLWSKTVDLPGPRFTNRQGLEPSRGEAGRRVVEAYERLMSRRDSTLS